MRGRDPPETTAGRLTAPRSEIIPRVSVRYSSDRQSRSLFHSTSFKHLHELYPHNPRIAEAGNDAFIVVSESLVDLREASEGMAIVAQRADVQQRPFSPRHK